MIVRENEQGIALGMVVAMSLVFAVAAFVAMTLSVSRGQTSSLQASRLKAQYAAEAGVVWAMQRLWGSPTWSSATGTDLTVNGTAVDVLLPACAKTPCEQRKLQTTVTY